MERRNLQLIHLLRDKRISVPHSPPPLTPHSTRRLPTLLPRIPGIYDERTEAEVFIPTLPRGRKSRPSPQSSVLSVPRAREDIYERDHSLPSPLSPVATFDEGKLFEMIVESILL